MSAFCIILALVVAVPTAAAAGARSAQTDSTPYLLPLPREWTYLRTVRLTSGVAVDRPSNADDAFATADFAQYLRQRGIRSAAAGSGALRISAMRVSQPMARRMLATHGLAFDDQLREAGYIILSDTAAAPRLLVIGASPVGVFYGLQTVKQLIDGNGTSARMHLVRILDWPAMRRRGLHDDLSRGPLPTLEFQKQQIRTLAAYKINVYSPYFEHSLQYASHPLMAPPAGSMSRAEIRELVAYARRYHIEVIPEQQAFGHLHHLLKWELYAPLAETSHGHVLAPGQPGSIRIVKDMFAELDSLFPSRFVHIGADETFELGRGQTAPRVEAEGIGSVYLDYVQQIEAALRPSGKRLLFWGDVAQQHPELVRTLPKNLIAVAWDYDPQPTFDRFLIPFRDAGIETWAAPGVKNWNRVYPDNDLALRNIQGFVRDAQRLGSTGILNTTWDDDGDAIFNQNWYGVLFGAAASWQSGESSIPRFERSFGRVFHGDTTGKIGNAQRKLAAAHTLLRDAELRGATNYLFFLDPWSSDGRRVNGKLLPIARDLRVFAESSLVLIAQARSQQLRNTDALDALELGARRIDWIGAKFQFADEIVRMYARALSADTTAVGRSVTVLELLDVIGGGGYNGRAQDLRDGFTELRQLYERAWMAENRPYWIRNVLARFDKSTQIWIDRIDRFTEVRQQWGRTRQLPPPETLGMPAPSLP